MVRLVKRGRVIHLGLRIDTTLDATYTVSVCSGLWTDKDATYKGELSEVTCTRCAKYVKETLKSKDIVAEKIDENTYKGEDGKIYRTKGGNHG